MDKDGRVDIWGFGTPLSTERTGGTTAFTSMLVAGGKVWENCKPNYASDNGIRAVQLHVDMINKFNVMPKEAITNHADDIVDQFIAGRYAIATLPFARYSQVQAQAKMGWRQPRCPALARPGPPTRSARSRCRAGGRLCGANRKETKKQARFSSG
ncbi:MAG: hypothetical protein IPO75_06670 [Betaproteobacteria bacterium]|nr:hypothetical protein [Betaproteobacteria bacterium]